MGGLCSRGVQVDTGSSQDSGLTRQSSSTSRLPNGSRQVNGNGKPTSVNPDVVSSPDTDDTTREDDDDANHNNSNNNNNNDDDNVHGVKSERKLSRVLSHRARNAKSMTTVVAKKGAAKVTEVLGRAGTAGFGKAVEALDTFGSSITNIGSGFGGGVAPKGNKIGILAFEVANTVVKGYSLKQSLSDESLQLLKRDVLPSEGVQRLVSKDLDELWTIAASDKRHELKVFSSEVIRFGNHCRAPEWHQLDRLFNRLGSEVPIPRQSNDEVEQKMQELLTLAQNTAELYHELHALDRYDNDVRRKIEENELSSNPHKGDSLAILKSDLKCQQKHVKLLKKKSLWSKIMEEVMEKLVDIVYYLHQQIADAFGEYTGDAAIKTSSVPRLGALGLALHYANIINQIDTLVSRPNSVPPNTRDNLYQGLPPSIKLSLRSALYAASNKEELTVSQIKEEMEKILDWLVPIASNTTKAHHGFGWVGEWASAGSALDRKPYVQEISLIQTLHHADQEVTEKYILELLVWLNLLISRTKSGHNNRSPHKSPFRSPIKKPLSLEQSPSPPQETAAGKKRSLVELSKEDQEMLSGAVLRKLTPGISKSQEFQKKPKPLSTRLTKSYSHSPLPNVKQQGVTIRRALGSLEFDIERIRVMDKMDRVDTLTGGPATG